MVEARDGHRPTWAGRRALSGDDQGGVTGGVQERTEARVRSVAMGASGLVAVVGGGPAGAAAAVTARELGCAVELYDAGRAPGARPGESLPPGGEDLVREIFGAFN